MCNSAGLSYITAYWVYFHAFFVTLNTCIFYLSLLSIVNPPTFLKPVCFCLLEVLHPSLQGYFWSRIWMGHENRPMAHSFACKNQDLMDHLKFWWAIWKKMIGPRNLNIHLTANWTSDLNSLCMGPSQKWNQNYSITDSFFIKWFGPITEISLDSYK